MGRLKNWLMIITMCLIIGTGMQVHASDTTTLHGDGIYDYDAANAVLTIVNTERAKVSLPQLTMDKELMDAAMLRSAECNFNFSHTRPDGSSCFTASDKMSGENIAAGYNSATSVMTGWMNSTGHRENILGSGFKSIGIGCYVIGNTRYWAQCFSGDVSTSIPEYSGTKPVNPEIVMKSSDVVLYAYEVKNESNGAYMLPGEDGYLVYGIMNTGWSGHFAPIAESDVRFSSSDSNVISVDSTGKFAIVGVGNANLQIDLVQLPSQKYISDNIVCIRLDLSDTTYTYVQGISDTYYYTGKEIKPVPEVYYTWSRELNKGTDYTLSYKDNVEPGTAKMIITGIGKYKGSLEISFKIQKKTTGNTGNTNPSTPTSTTNTDKYTKISKTNIIYAKGGKKKVNLKWKKVSNGQVYKIYRSTKQTKGFKCIKTTYKKYSFVDKKVKSKKTYYYKIKVGNQYKGKWYYSGYSKTIRIKAK